MDSAARRASALAAHVVPELQREVVGEPCAGVAGPDDVVICVAVRTAVTKAKRGAFRTTGLDKLLTPLFKHIMKTPGLDASQIGDVIVGNVLPLSSISATEVRIAGLVSGVPTSVPVHTLNRQCSSGLQAIATAAANIKAGQYGLAIAGGVENMSMSSMSDTGNLQMNDEALAHKDAAGCYLNMGQTSEEVASRFGVTRQEQDEFAVLSHKKAAAAIKSGAFKAEIIPVEVELEDPKTGKTTKVIVSEDDGVREDTSMATLAKLKTVFKENGTTTAGNASPTNDGAALTLVARRSVAIKLGLPIIGCLRSWAVVGVEPAIMGVGPAEAIPEAIKRAGLKLSDIDVFEINEAFASQALYCVKKLGIPAEKVNPNGGAIALGHALGCTGARLTATLLSELKQRHQRLGVVSMCIGSGMGMAAVFERE